MTKAITIAVDAMGGDNSPKKIVEGINLHYKKSKNIFYKIFGDSEKIKEINNTLLHIINPKLKLDVNDIFLINIELNNYELIRF